ncbi:MAG: SsrA-binding protein SmpB [Acidobacteria bacterium]|nr:SsrA-binding protein SmpB [Acidobacteriota bacterium]
MSQKDAQAGDSIKLVADNRRARHEYHFLETLEAGIVLTGSEVKSARAGKVQLRDSYAAVEHDELFLYNAHISQYEQANRNNHDPTTVRKLLVHRREINRLIGKTRLKGLTLVPTKMYFKNGRLKVELALAKGKQLHDKRETIKKRDQEAEARAALSPRRV